MSQLGVEFIDLNGYSIPSEMAQILPKNIAKKHSVVPIRVTRTDIRSLPLFRFSWDSGSGLSPHYRAF